MILFPISPEKLAFGANIDKIEVLFCNMIKSHNLFIGALFLIVEALWHISLLECGVMNDVLTHDKVGGFRLQIRFINTIFKLVAILGSFLMVTNFAFVEEGPLGAILGFIGVEHVVAVLAKSLSCELGGH